MSLEPKEKDARPKSILDASPAAASTAEEVAREWAKNLPDMPTCEDDEPAVKVILSAITEALAAATVKEEETYPEHHILDCRWLDCPIHRHRTTEVLGSETPRTSEQQRGTDKRQHDGFKWESIAIWPEGTCGRDDISIDLHDNKDAALCVCGMLMRNGFGGDKQIFPIRTTVRRRTPAK